jgi:cation transport regulator
MPYPTIESLPDSIKGSLPKEAQEIFRNAFNSAEKQHNGDEERANKIAWGAVKNAGFEKQDDKWVKQNTDNLTHEFEAEIFSVGTWNGDKYTEADLQAMVDAFPKLSDEVKPPVKMGHSNKLADGDPALGWVKGLRLNGDKLVAKLSDVPDILFKAIKQGLYKRVSSEIYWNYKKAGETFKRVLSGVALLGADIPAVKNLADLKAYLTQSASDDGLFEQVVVFAETQAEIIKGEPDNMEAEVKELTEKLAAESEARKKSDEEAKTYREKAEAMEKEASDKLKATSVDEVKAFCEEQVKAGKLLPTIRDDIVKGLEVEAGHCYSEKGGAMIEFEVFKKYVETVDTLLNTDEEGRNNDKDKKEYASAGEQVDALVKEITKEGKVNYSDALQSVLTDPKHEELANKYTEETKGGEA